MRSLSLSLSLLTLVGILAPLQFLSKVFLQKITPFPLGIKVLHTCLGEIEAGGPDVSKWRLECWTVYRQRNYIFYLFGGADATGLARTAGKADSKFTACEMAPEWGHFGCRPILTPDLMSGSLGTERFMMVIKERAGQEKWESKVWYYGQSVSNTVDTFYRHHLSKWTEGETKEGPSECTSTGTASFL